MADTTVKGLKASTEVYDGSDLRILIVHARWNDQIITPLVQGAVAKLQAGGVKKENIVIESIPGSYELPITCSKMIAASQIQASSLATDLLGSTANLLSSAIASPTSPTSTTSVSTKPLSSPFSACIAIGCLIKGQTSHYEYISEAVTQGLMRVQLDTGVPVIYGVLNCLKDEQALMRAGIGGESGKEGHNHGEDWGNAALELAAKSRKWAKGVV